jgi:uncharacterized protein YjbI with pentapeptide repeats
MADKIDPFDVAALEKSLNDSATRVSTIWASFLIFSLYLLTAATTVTHRQLFLAEPVKLPVLNIDLPLWGFFFLAPILFVILHTYVLIQVILLSRTAAAYNSALAKIAERDNLTSEENASLRQRLANTLFAQIFAGSPREREGAFGWLLRAMAWLTLAISPILILLTFQFTFLPYHSHGVTWTHRLLILLEFVVAFQLWPLVLDPQRDVRWPQWRAGVRPAGEGMRSLLRAPEPALRVGRALRRWAVPLGVGLILACLALWLASFPGEWHINVVTGQPVDAVQCERLLHQHFRMADLRVDRLNVQRADVVDDEKLEKIEKATERNGEQPYEGERTRLLRGRDLNCGDFSDFADLRRVDFSDAQLRNAKLSNSKLHGSSFARAQLQGAILVSAQLQSALLDNALLQAANLDRARLQRASLRFAHLESASLSEAELQGAQLDQARLQGASLWGAELQGASLDGAELQGARLHNARLHGASLLATGLQVADLSGAQLQGAMAVRTHLQGAEMSNAKLALAEFSETWIWRTLGSCSAAHVIDPVTDAWVGGNPVNPISAEEIDKLVDEWVAGVPSAESRAALRKRFLARLSLDTADKAPGLSDTWRLCVERSAAVPQEDFDSARMAFLRGLVCDSGYKGAAIAAGIAAKMVLRYSPTLRTELSRALLGEDGRPCPAASGYDPGTRGRLRTAADEKPPAAK